MESLTAYPMGGPFPQATRPLQFERRTFTHKESVPSRFGSPLPHRDSRLATYCKCDLGSWKDSITLSGGIWLAILTIAAIGAAGVLPGSTIGYAAVGLGGAYLGVSVVKCIRSHHYNRQEQRTQVLQALAAISIIVVGALGIAGGSGGALLAAKPLCYGIIGAAGAEFVMQKLMDKGCAPHRRVTYREGGGGGHDAPYSFGGFSTPDAAIRDAMGRQQHLGPPLSAGRFRGGDFVSGAAGDTGAPFVTPLPSHDRRDGGNMSWAHLPSTHGTPGSASTSWYFDHSLLGGGSGAPPHSSSGAHSVDIA